MPKGLARFLLYAAILLVALAGFNEASDFGISPVWIFLAAILLPCLLIALAKFPAAFFIPLLFISRQKELPIPAPIRHVIDVTALPLGAALLGVALIFRLIDRRNRRGAFSLGDLFRGQGKGIASFLLFAAVVTTSYLYTRAPGYGGDKLVSFLTVGALMFFAPFIILEDDRDFRHFAIGTIAFGLMLAFARIIAGSQGVFGQHEEVTHIGIGQLMGMAILLVLNYKFVESRAARNLLILCLPLLAAGLIAAEARGPLLALLPILVASLFIRRREMSLISPRAAMLGVAVIVAALVIVPGQWFQGEAAKKFQVKSQELVEFAQGGSYSEKGSGGRRLVFFDAALDGIAEKPAAGWGVGGWATYYWHNDAWEYPHNLFLEVGVEEGLLGLAALLAFLAIAFKAAKKAFDEASGRFAFVLPVVAYCVLLTLSSGDIDDNRFLWFWCSVAFVACRMISSDRQEEAPASPASVS
jgi:O-antigen ligase/uncharacterized membrane protein YhdT